MVALGRAAVNGDAADHRLGSHLDFRIARRQHHTPAGCRRVRISAVAVRWGVSLRCAVNRIGLGMSRREFVKAAGVMPLAASFSSLSGETKDAVTLGEWSDDSAGLPCYHYAGPVPFVSPSSKISAEYLPADPFFLLGNYR